MNIPDEAISVYDLAYDDTLPIVQAEHAAIIAVAEWARAEALREATVSLPLLAYAVNTNLTAFPSHWAVDLQAAVDVIRAIAKGGN